MSSSKFQKLLNINSKNTSKEFNLDELISISFGQLEGEKDNKLNEDTFYPTYSIQKVLKKNINYVLSPKGVGKSALFSSIVNKYIPSEIFDYKDHSIIPVNQSFGNDSQYLDPKKFKKETSRNNYAIHWGLYLLGELIKDIVNNHKDKANYSEFIKKIKRIEDLKDKFRLYNISDVLNQVNIGFTFTISGLPIEVSPSLKINKTYDKLNLNDLYSYINKFYKENNLIALIIIDRIDNFVSKEAHVIQKNYIQGLIDCIEEITVFNNIDPLLLIRTDLFYTFDIKFEYDKVKDKKIELNWAESETLNFIIYRILSNKYIFENYFGHFLKFTLEERGVNFKKKRTILKNCLCWFRDLIKGGKSKKLKKDIPYKVATNFLNIFFPKKILNLDFGDWVIKYFKDANGFINPRLLIYYFNQLFENRNLEFQLNRKINDQSIIKIKNGDTIHFDIFSENHLIETFEFVRKEEIRNIYKLLKSKEHQLIYKDIVLKVKQNNGNFKYGDINVKKYNIQKEDYDTMLKYLQLLGYCKEVLKSQYQVPLIYIDNLTLTGENNIR